MRNHVRPLCTVVVIQKLEPDAWSSTYYTAVGQVSAGPSVGVGAGQTSSWTEFETPYNWTSGNFAGRYTAMVGSGGGALLASGIAPASVTAGSDVPGELLIRFQPGVSTADITTNRSGSAPAHALLKINAVKNRIDSSRMP